MTEKNWMADPPQKVLAMYEAVVALVSEGADISSMKVSDITNRAGIGKGTAYEYFSSKEEIITSAIAYDVETKRAQLQNMVEGAGSFEEKFMRILGYMVDNFPRKETFCLLVRIGTGSYEISESMRMEYEKLQQTMDCGQLENIVRTLMQQGISEHIITEENSYLQRMAFSAQTVAFAGWLVEREQGKLQTVTVQQAKAFAYASLVKSLN